jgi:hypothetical protein
MARVATRRVHAARQCEHGAGRLFRGELYRGRRDLDLHHARRPLHRSYRRAGRQVGGVRDQVHVRRRALAAISDRVARRTLAGTRHRLGDAAGGGGRTALVPPLPRPAPQGGRPAALDRHRPELELSVRRLPLHRPAQELRRRGRHVQDHVGGNQRRLRGLPRTRLDPRRLGAAAARAARVDRQLRLDRGSR